MFKFNEIKSLHLEITNNCQASCPMCSRNVDSGLVNPLIKINEWSMDDFKSIMTEELLTQIHSYYYCGTFGDPILNDNLIDMCRYSTTVAPQVHVAIHTNGSARPVKWWQDLATALPKDHVVVFALDGLEDTQHLYRVGTNFKTIIRNASAFIKAGGNAHWCFIRFKHNEHQVDEARAMAEELGFSKFVLKNSSRFVLEPRKAVRDKTTEAVMYYVEPATDTPLKFIDQKVINSYKQILATSKISCKAKNDREIYIDAYRDFYPCCWMANIPYTPILNDGVAHVRNEMKRQHDELMKKLGDVNLISRPLKDLINSDEFQHMWDKYWNEDKLIVCARSCGESPDSNFAQTKDQEVKD